MTNEQYKTAFKEGYEKAMQELSHRQYLEGLQRANQDPTGQDLDDYHKRTHEPDNYDHVECQIQRAELRFGA